MKTMVVQLTGEPELIEEEDRVLVTAEGEVVPTGAPVRVTLQPRGPGDFYPFRVGDRLACVALGGQLLGGVVPLGAYLDVTPPQAMGNREVRARDGGHLVLAPARGDAGSQVRLGREERGGATYERLMLYERAAQELRSLKAQIDALATWTTTLTCPSGKVEGVGLAANRVAAVANPSIEGGEASEGVVAAKG